MAWVKRVLRGKEVHARCDADGVLQPGPGGRIDIVYSLRPGAKIYRASPRNLEMPADPLDLEPIEAEIGTGEEKAPAAGGKQLPDDAVIIYTDGACTGNPGPMGIGAVIRDGDQVEELSEYLGEGTNNIAELTAILRAIELLTDEQRQRTVAIHSDSSYSIGLLTKNWKAKKNVELVARLREEVAALEDVRFIKVKGHAGIPDNERCDELATSAIARGR